MGEPTYNFNVIQSAYWLAGFFESKGWGFHPVVSTMCPKNNKLLSKFIDQWLNFKNTFGGNAGLQLSINTTDEDKRNESFNGNCLSLQEIGLMMERLIKYVGLTGRKIALNFALTDDEINAQVLRSHFNPEHFLCKITPMHMTKSCSDSNIITRDGYEKYYPYKDVEERLKAVGFDVIVFIPSKEEDESRITCGNAILAGGTK